MKRRLERGVALALYYTLAKRMPTQPVPGWRLAYALRRALVRRIFAACGTGIIVKRNAYFGTGETLVVGRDSQLGENSRIGPQVTIGDDVVMGPDVVIHTTSHAFDDLSRPLRLQGATPIEPVTIGNDVWIGTRVIIMPGVTIGNQCVVGANSVVTRDLPARSVAAGVPCRVIRTRGAD